MRCVGSARSVCGGKGRMLWGKCLCGSACVATDVVAVVLGLQSSQNEYEGGGGMCVRRCAWLIGAVVGVNACR